MIVNEFPDRKIKVDGVDYLYFGGTNYLGMSTNTDFQNILFESIKKWETSYGSSRNSNIELSIYKTAEKLLAKNINTEAALTVSSGMLAGKLVIEYLLKTTDAIFHFPDAHPAIMSSQSLLIKKNGELNSKIFDESITKITVLSDAIPSLCIEPIDLSILLKIPKEKKITLVIDESHSLGIYGNEWQNILKKENIKIIKVASLGKALGLSGGVIAGNSSFISEIRNLDCFIGASGMNPAFLETYINAQKVYLSQKQKLLQNLIYIDANFTKRELFTFNANYPNIYFEDESISKKLLENKIITTSFKHTNASGRLNRIVITSNHTTQDLEQLLTQLNSNL
ncbi:aminotransferase class I/II-fold pyridoxal phosphate-dependent enzyme [Flavobacterium soyangense]|uniref:Pyridoxal phosphate-dependent aminotransferase family protein n=1 Tax=Flavobacterium soyangense TaxID=2023265 RepID=A0A930XUW1_9FLAO|nr:aminotransferase class I/II-fold pyridoxal phosphate-dependent enzyme [Flavobacterium soyangense]MBF2709005.1 pyridoxal phosphate-dependent aminotransferase family protein [Flavobacterium soyangense]